VVEAEARVRFAEGDVAGSAPLFKRMPQSGRSTRSRQPATIGAVARIQRTW
jgi:hypothetical protein